MEASPTVTIRPRSGPRCRASRTILGLGTLALVAASSGPRAQAATVTSRFDAVAVIANPNGYTIDNLGLTIDGSTAGTPLAGIWAGANATGVVIDYSFTEPRTRMTGLRLWNQAGGILTDQDGIGSATVEVFDQSNNVLLTTVLVAGNGGAPFDTIFPTPLDAVARVRLTNITSQISGAVGGPRPLWPRAAGAPGPRHPRHQHPDQP